MGVVQYNQA